MKRNNTSLYKIIHFLTLRRGGGHFWPTMPFFIFYIYCTKLLKKFNMKYCFYNVPFVKNSKDIFNRRKIRFWILKLLVLYVQKIWIHFIYIKWVKLIGYTLKQGPIRPFGTNNVYRVNSRIRIRNPGFKIPYVDLDPKPTPRDKNRIHH